MDKQKKYEIKNRALEVHKATKSKKYNAWFIFLNSHLYDNWLMERKAGIRSAINYFLDLVETFPYDDVYLYKGYMPLLGAGLRKTGVDPVLICSIKGEKAPNYIVHIKD